MICSSLNRLLRIVRPLADGLSFRTQELNGSRSLQLNLTQVHRGSRLLHHNWGHNPRTSDEGVAGSGDPLSMARKMDQESASSFMRVLCLIATLDWLRR